MVSDDVHNQVAATSVGSVVQGGVVHLHPPSERPAVVPRQLPVPPRGFIGRAAELRLLDDDDGPVLISAIGGTGGIGKTWLALQWAHAHADRFPDGQLFVDLSGFTPGSEPMSAAVVVRGFLDALGVEPARLPVDPHARFALYRSLVADKRLLIVLDNAADSEQVVPLLPGSGGCTVIITSRRTLTSLTTGHGARHVPLGVLSVDESRGMLAERLDAKRIADDPTAVDDLVEFCGGHTLALSIVAGHAHIRPHLPLAVFASELREAGLAALSSGDATACLPTAIASSYRTLGAEQARLFCLLGIAPGTDTSLLAAVNLIDRELPHTMALLRDLEDASLITRNTDGRYRMHDLIRKFAAERARSALGDVERDSALKRVIDFYVQSSQHCERVFHPYDTDEPVVRPDNGLRVHLAPDEPTALAWMTAEHLCLLAAQLTAADHGWHEEVWVLAMTLDIFHLRRAHLHQRIIVWQLALAASQHMGPRAVIRALAMYGEAFCNVEMHDDALPHVKSAVDLARELGTPLDQATSHSSMAWVLTRRGEYVDALAHATLAHDINTALGRTVAAATALSHMCRSVAHLGDYDCAESYAVEALAVHRLHGNRTGQANALAMLGYIEHHTDRQAPAIEHYQQALRFVRGMENIYLTSDALEGIGHPLRAVGRHDEARAAWLEALELFEVQQRSADAERTREHLASLDA
ncbi:tetratricopeptide repeat protein [Actinosynnema sp. NPDC051121]|nr:tetratricopeptide repeat protein [Saccharothrix sp.]